MNKKAILLISFVLIANMAIAKNYVVKHKTEGHYISNHGMAKVVICHKGKNTITIALSAWKVHKAQGGYLGKCKDTSTGDINTTVPEIQPDWTVTTYPNLYGSRPNLIKRVVEKGFGVVFDEYSDGSCNVFTNTERGQVKSTYNTERGIQHEFEYYEDGKIKQDISHETWEDNPNDYYVTTYTYSEDGTSSNNVYKTLSGDYKVGRNTLGSLERGTEATQEEIDLFDSVFK